MAWRWLGLEGAALLEKQMQRLKVSTRHLIWLNPLLQGDAFAPKAACIRAMLGHVDSFGSTHSIAALAGVADVISSQPNDPSQMFPVKKPA